MLTYQDVQVMCASRSTSVADNICPIFFVFNTGMGNGSSWANQMDAEIVASTEPFVFQLIIGLQSISMSIHIVTETKLMPCTPSTCARLVQVTSVVVPLL